VANIDNIVCFDRLTSLSLSNNRIKEVKNIEHLVTLTSLDLSFNQIEALPESLALLVNLRELSLHSNGLADLTTIDKLPQLSVLNVGELRVPVAPPFRYCSCKPRTAQCSRDSAMAQPTTNTAGRNKITALESFLPLRKLDGLRALTAIGNPCADKYSDDYESYVLAYLGSNVRWLDYRVVEAEKVAACKEQFQNELEALASSEGIKKAEAVQAERDKIFRAELQQIYLLEAVTL